MENYFTDNEDIQFYLNDARFKDIFELRETGYTENIAYQFAPEDFEDALDNCHRVLSLAGQLSAEILAPTATDTDRHGCTLKNNVVSYAPGTQEVLKRFAQADLFGFTLPRKYSVLNFPLTVYMMAVEILMAVLLLENSRKSDRKLNLAKKFVTDTFHRVQMLSGKIIYSDENIFYKDRHLLD